MKASCGGGLTSFGMPSTLAMKTFSKLWHITTMSYINKTDKNNCKKRLKNPIKNPTAKRHYETKTTFTDEYKFVEFTAPK